MKTKIIGMIHPYNLKQNFFVYKDGNKIAAEQIKIDDIPSAIVTLSRQYDANQIYLSGSAPYNRGLKNLIEQEEMNQYNQNTLEIKIM